MNMRNIIYWYTLVSLVVIFVDRLSKAWALAYCALPYRVHPFLVFEHMCNRGISWSLLHFEDARLFWLVTAGVIAVTVGLCSIALSRFLRQRNIMGEVLVISGSLSNIIDRFMYGGVIDFIALQYEQWTFPVFNGADVAIVCGVCVMVWEYFSE